MVCVPKIIFHHRAIIARSLLHVQVIISIIKSWFINTVLPLERVALQGPSVVLRVRAEFFLMNTGRFEQSM